MEQISAAAAEKRRALKGFIERHVIHREVIRAIVVYGSVANGAAVAESDVDAIVFMDPVDPYLLPAEAIWNPHDDSFRSIFSSETRPDDLQLDFKRVSWGEWASPSFTCPDVVRAHLDTTWVAYCRDGYDPVTVIERITTMTDDQQLHLIDEALLAVDGVPEDPSEAWERDPLEAVDGLAVQWDALLRCIYAINKVWFPYRGRAVRNLRSLPWYAGLRGELLIGCVGGATDRSGYEARAGALLQVRESVLTRLTTDPRYDDDPIFAAFLRQHDEPGRAWNMAEWNERHALR